MSIATVIVVDPHRELAEMAGEVLRDRGYEVIVAWRLSQLNAVLEGIPTLDVVVCHATVPNFFGDQPHNIIELMGERPQLGLVVISSRPFDDLMILPTHAIRLLKPFGANELLSAITSARRSRIQGVPGEATSSGLVGTEDA